MINQKILVTTTPSIEGWEIQSYLGPVVAHIVAGTGFFSDFAASFTDVFGGRSQTYQKQLAAINSEAIEQLKNKASLLGGNIILGLRIDHDEISGKAKQMFMVTAYGTAVLGNQKSSSSKITIGASNLSADAMDNAIIRGQIIEQCSEVPFDLSDEEWIFASEHQIHEIATQVLSTINYILSQHGYDGDTTFNPQKNYLLSIPTEYLIPILYNTIKENSKLHNFLISIIEEANLVDYPQLMELLNSEIFAVKICAIQITEFNKQFYSIDDIQQISLLIEKIKSSFPIRVKYQEAKQLFSSSTKKMWLCECGKSNEEITTVCESCTRDIYGVKTSEMEIDGILQILQNKIDILKHNFGKD